MNNKGFVFIETIIVICVLTISLMSLYANYNKIISNTKELNTFDTTEYNYKTYFLKKKYMSDSDFNSSDPPCKSIPNPFALDASDNTEIKICKLTDVSSYIDDADDANDYLKKFDAYIIDYLNSKDFNSNNDNIFLVEYKKKDINYDDLYITYISSLTY